MACGNLEPPGAMGRCEANSAPVPRAGQSDGRRGILLSLDAMGSNFLGQELQKGQLPSFAALVRAGASTLNARADHEYTVTLPNHTTMLTGRPVSADPDLPVATHHGWTTNGMVDASVTLHNGGNPNLSYVASVFDVVHDHGLATCMYAGKAKFELFSNSYNSRNGAPDRVGDDDGRNKLDRVVIAEQNTEVLITALEADLAGGACAFAFLHVADLDVEGHALGWGSSGWLDVLARVDGWLGRVAAFADPNHMEAPFFLVVTADHGGDGDGHSDETAPGNYTIPFFVVGPEIPLDTDLYGLSGRTDPGTERVRYSNPAQPVRNADAANLMTHLLGLPPVPGSFMRDLLM
jgi:hypothetical protein